MFLRSSWPGPAGVTPEAAPIPTPALDAVPRSGVYHKPMPMTISQVARAAGVNAETVRYYERRRLVPAPNRTPSGYRQYGDETVRRIRFIKRAQALGFTLEEIRGLLELRVRRPSACDAVRRSTEAHLVVVNQKIAELGRLRGTLQYLADECLHRRSTTECPILSALEHDEPARS